MSESRKKKPWERWEDHIEKQIREAMERGDFENLKGKGKPQEFSSYSKDPTKEMANKIVKDAGFAPAWIELEREIDREQADAEAHIVRSWRWREAVRGDAIEDPHWVDAEWRKARTLFENRLQALNVKILSYNLQLPHPLLHKQRPRLKIETAFEKLGIVD